MRFRRLAVSLASLALSAASVQAQTVFDNGTPDNRNGHHIIGNTRTANDFTLAGSTSLSRFNWWAIIDQRSGPSTILADYTVRLYDNASGMPGTNLFTRSYTDQTGTADGSFCCGFSRSYTGYTFSADLDGLALDAGTYWISVNGFSSTASFGGNFWMTSSQNGNQQQSSDGESWGPRGDEGAFNLTASDTTVTPEPASLALVACGMVGLAAVARRRRSTVRA